MLRTSRRVAVLAAVGIIGIPLTIAATAYACANLMSAKLNRASATPLTQVQFMGRNFNSNAAASPVAIRWNGRRGAILFEGRPAKSGKLSTKIRVPNVRPGYYMILATQIGPNGKPAAGSPARAVLKVVRRSSNSSVVAAPVTPGGPAGPTAPLAIGLGLSGLLLVGGLTAVAVRRRRIPTGLSSTA